MLLLPNNVQNRRRALAKISDEMSAGFQKGWDAAITAARHWHEAKAQQAIVQSRRTRFPKNLEREADVHRLSAEMMSTLSPEDA